MALRLLNQAPFLSLPRTCTPREAHTVGSWSLAFRGALEKERGASRPHSHEAWAGCPPSFGEPSNFPPLSRLGAVRQCRFSAGIVQAPEGSIKPDQGSRVGCGVPPAGLGIPRGPSKFQDCTVREAPKSGDFRAAVNLRPGSSVEVRCRHPLPPAFCEAARHPRRLGRRRSGVRRSAQDGSIKPDQTFWGWVRRLARPRGESVDRWGTSGRQMLPAGRGKRQASAYPENRCAAAARAL